MKTLFRATVGEFFRQRAGLFFVLFGLVFGFLRASEHQALAMFFLTGSYGMLFLLLIWLAYTLFCVQFLVNIWATPEYSFVYHARLWPPALRLFRFVQIGGGFLLPLIAYGTYMFSLAVSADILPRTWPLLPYYMVLILAIVGAEEWRLRNPAWYVRARRKQFRWPFPRPKSLIYWTFEWLIRERGVTFLLGKVGAMLATLATMLYYQTDTYDLRLPAIGMGFAFLLNLGVSWELYQWESNICLWVRSMPASRWQRFGRILIFHAILILPELLVAARSGALDITELLQLFVLGASLLTLSHLYLYKKEGSQDLSMQTFLFGFIAFTLLVLYKIPLLLLAAVAFAFSFYQYPKWYRI